MNNITYILFGTQVANAIFCVLFEIIAHFFNITYLKVTKVLLYSSCFACLIYAIFMPFYSDFYIAYGGIPIILVCYWQPFMKRNFREQVDFENGATSYNPRIARAQMNYYKSLSLPEREEYMEQYRKNAEWFPKLWQMILLQGLSISIGFFIGFITKLLIKGKFL